MKKIILFIILSISLFALSDKTKDSISRDFNAFKKNYSERNSNETVKYFSKSSIELYDRLLKVAIGQGEIPSDKEFIESMIILSINNRFTEAEIKKMNGEDVIKWSINEGLDSFENFNSLPILDIYEKDGYAFIVMGDAKESIPLRLSYEDNIWKVDLPYLLEIINKTFLNLFGGETFKDTFSGNETQNSYFNYGGELHAPRSKKSNHNY